MNISPIRALSDNYIWLIKERGCCFIVDPGEHLPVIKTLEQQSLKLEGILITHHHFDHTDGISPLQTFAPNTPVYGHGDIQGVTHPVKDGDVITLFGRNMEVWQTPGHTRQHTSYLLHDELTHIFCGDTLFSAGCGRVFDGTMAELFASLRRFQNLPDTTLLYPAHEYTRANLRFAAVVEPQNPDVAAALEIAHLHPTLPTSLAHENKVNPFLRADVATVQEAACRRMQVATLDAFHTFEVLREWKNVFK